jgi:hypothetical protein
MFSSYMILDKGLLRVRVWVLNGQCYSIHNVTPRSPPEPPHTRSPPRHNKTADYLRLSAVRKISVQCRCDREDGSINKPYSLN